MKRVLKKLLQGIANVPVIGRPLRIAAALYRLPEFSQQLTQLQRNTEQSSLGKQDLDNLAISVPVALRKLRRDVDHLLTRSSQER